MAHIEVTQHITLNAIIEVNDQELEDFLKGNRNLRKFITLKTNRTPNAIKSYIEASTSWSDLVVHYIESDDGTEYLWDDELVQQE